MTQNEIENYFGCEVMNLEVSKPNSYAGISEVERQLITFSRRLHQIESRNVKDEEVYIQVKDFVETLKKMKGSEEICTWKAFVKGVSWGGWCLNGKVIYCLQRTT